MSEPPQRTSFEKSAHVQGCACVRCTGFQTGNLIGQGSSRLATGMEVVAWLAVAAGAADLLVENSAVAVGLWSSPSDAAARIARVAGRVKLALLAAVSIGLLIALVVLLAT